MKLRLFIFAFSAALVLVGCKNKRSNDEYIVPDGPIITSADSTKVLSLVNDFIQSINNHDIEGMVDQLHYFRDNRIYPFDELQRDSVKRGLQQIPIYAAKLYSLQLSSNVNNEVGILVQLIENGSLDNEIGVSKMYVIPIQIGDEWYLTLPDLNNWDNECQEMLS